jgi:hypothetical protein
MNGGMKINMLGFVHVHDINGHDLDISSSDIMIIMVINGEKLLLMVIISSYGKYIHLIIAKYGSFPKISSHGTHGSFRSHGGTPKHPAMVTWGSSILRHLQMIFFMSRFLMVGIRLEC